MFELGAMLELGAWGWSLAGWVVGISAWTAVVFALVRGLDAGTRRVVGPRVRLLLYAAVLVRLALPLDFTTPLGLVNSSTPRVAAAPVELPDQVGRAQQADHAAAALALEAPLIEGPTLLGEAARGEASTAADMGSWSSSPALGSLLLLIYGAGVLGCLGLWLTRRRRLAEVIAASEPMPSADGVELREHALAGPFAHGLVRRVVIVPAGLRARLQPEILDRLLAHERAHHHHADPWIVAALAVVAALAWPVVPVWLTLRRARRLIEEAADERALRGASDATRRAYGKALIELADGSTSMSEPNPALGAFHELESRVTALVRPVTTPGWAQLGIGLTLTGALAACMTPADAELPEADVSLDRCDALVVRATTQHDDAEKGKGELPLALASYHEYIDACPNHPDYADMLYYAGEAHWAQAHAGGERHEYRQAAELFQRVLDHDSDYELDAAYGQLLSTFNAVGWSDDRPAPRCEGDCEGFPELPYDEDERAVIDSWSRYVATVGRPLDGRGDDQLRVAELFMQHNDFDAARPELEELVRRAGDDEADVRAAEMLVDLLTIAWVEADIAPAEALRRGDELDAWLVELERAPFYAHAEADRLREAAETLRAGVEWKRAIADMAAAEAGELDGYRRCAARFEALAVAHPEHAQIDELERNAEVCRSRAD